MKSPNESNAPKDPKNPKKPEKSKYSKNPFCSKAKRPFTILEFIAGKA